MLLLRNFSRFGKGRAEVLTCLDLGSLAGFAACSCLVEAFRLGTSLEAGVCFEEGGLVLVEAYSLLGTSEACLEVAVSDNFMGEPSGEDSISSITEGPCLVVLLFLENP